MEAQRTMTTALQPCERKTRRLLLRGLRAADAPDMFAIYSDPPTMKYWSCPPIKTREEAAAMVADDLRMQQEEKAAFWAIVLPATGRVIGKFSLFDISREHARAEVGYVLNRQFWRKGYMKEVAPVMLDLAFSEYGLHRLEADIEPDNLASLALLRKLGFRQEGYLRDRWHMNGEWQDSVLMALLAPEWKMARAR